MISVKVEPTISVGGPQSLPISSSNPGGGEPIHKYDILPNPNAENEEFVRVMIIDKTHQQDSRANSSARNTALCPKCGKGFSSNYNLKRHLTSCKLCPDREKGPRYQCDCGRSYTQEWDMKKHKASCHDNPKKCKKCPFCSLLFYHKLQLQAHMKRSHNVSVQEPEIHEFQNIDDFKLWKEQVEESTYTYYSKQTGGNVTGVSVNTYYVCQHDGSDRVHGSYARKTERRNKKGRVKTGQLCWSQMNVKEFRDGTVRVTYHPSHTHIVTASDTKHHPLPASINNEIDRRVAELKPEPDPDDPEEAGIDVETKKAKKRSLPVNARSLRALARKNRKLFRITAEAIQGSEESHSIDGYPVGHIKPQPAEDVVNIPIEAPVSVDTCTFYCDQLRSYCQSGNLSDNLMSQMEMVLADLVENCRQDVLRSEDHTTIKQKIVLDCNNVMDQVKANPGIDLIDQKAVYQVVALRPKSESPLPNEELIYQSAVDRFGQCEFLIITNASDSSQVFQSTEEQ